MSIKRPIRNKLVGFLIVPVLTVLFFAGLSIHGRYIELVKTRQSLNFIEIGVSLADVVLALQGERSFSTNYVRMKRWHNEEHEDLIRQRLVTNAELATFSRQLAETQAQNVNWSEFETLILGLEHLGDARDAVTLRFADGSPYYDALIEAALAISGSLSSPDLEIVTGIDAYNTLLLVTERAWQEHDLIGNVIFERRIESDELVRISRHVGDQDSELRRLSKSLQRRNWVPQKSPLLEASTAQVAFREQVIQQAIESASLGDLVDEIRHYIASAPEASSVELTQQYIIGLSRKLARFAEIASLTSDDLQVVRELQQIPMVQLELARNVQLGTTDAAVAQLIVSNLGLLVHDMLDMLEHPAGSISYSQWRDATLPRVAELAMARQEIGQRLGYQSKRLMADAASALLFYALLSLLCLSLSAFIGYLLIRRLVTALDIITNRLKSMRDEEDSDALFEIDGDDEISAIASAYDQLLLVRSELESNRRAMQEEMLTRKLSENQRLERQVDERTRELRLATKQAERANEAKSRFLGNISHHLRTPLNVMLGNTQILLRDTRLAAENLRRVENVNQHGQTLMALLNDILQFASLGYGDIEIEAAPMSLDVLLTSVFDEFVEAASRKELDFRVHRAGSVPSQLICDADKLRKAIACLVDNAIKFSLHGSVQICVSRHETDQEVEHSDDSGFTLCIEISDTGPGISENVSAVFDQEIDGCEQLRGGVGVGLALAQGLVSAMSGQWRLKTGATGTTVGFTLAIPNSGQLDGHPAFDLAVGTASGVDVGNEATIEQWQKITQSTWHSLVQALDRADILTIAALCDEIRETDAGLGQQLHAYAERYDYEKLREDIHSNVGGLAA